MGGESSNCGPDRFDLEDLGLLIGSTEREYDIITRNAGMLLHTSAAMFCVLDEGQSSVFVRSRFMPRCRDLLPDRFGRDGSMFAKMIEKSEPVRLIDLSEHHEYEGSFEPSVIPFKSVLSSPVYGPARETIGALVVLCSIPRRWSDLEQQELADLAHLVSRHVMLRASLETLKRMSREREALFDVPRFRN